MTPVRIQRKRSKGWKMPENTVYVGRGSAWGNPFRVGGHFMVGDPFPEKGGPFKMVWCEAHPDHADSRFTLIETRERAVEMYRKLCAVSPPSRLNELRGKNLACWCPIGCACHADVLLELANAEAAGQETVRE